MNYVSQQAHNRIHNWRYCPVYPRNKTVQLSVNLNKYYRYINGDDAVRVCKAHFYSSKARQIYRVSLALFINQLHDSQRLAPEASNYNLIFQFHTSNSLFSTYVIFYIFVLYVEYLKSQVCRWKKIDINLFYGGLINTIAWSCS